MNQRAKTIMYLIENGHIKENNEAEYVKSLLKYIVDVYENDKITSFGDVLVESQNGEKYSEEKIYSNPFEEIYKINSTYGRLQTLFRFEELTSMPAFIRLESMDQIIGWLARKEIDIRGIFMIIYFNLYRNIKEPKQRDELLE